MRLLFAIATLCVSICFINSCGNSKSGAENNHAGGKNNDDRVINLFVWSDYLAPDTITSFEKSTGIKVHAADFDTNETLSGLRRLEIPRCQHITSIVLRDGATLLNTL